MSSQVDTDSKSASNELSTKKRVGFRIALVAMFCVLVEVVARIALSILVGTSFLHPGDALTVQYQLEPLQATRIVRSDDTVDILLLGGSAIMRGWGWIPETLGEELLAEGYNVRIYSLGRGAHSTKDSLTKYERLSGKQFDLVILYHGINETRANNCPPDVFRPDYSHYEWYRMIAAMKSDSFGDLSAVPLVLRLVLIRAARVSGMSDLVPMHKPKPEWLEFGVDVKSKEPFRDNIESIIELSRDRGDPLLIPTFAYYIPENYSRERFMNRELDYVRHRAPIDLWGRVEAVRAGIEAHNGVVRDLHGSHPDVHFCDLAVALSGDSSHFDDICHLSIRGSRAWVEAAMPSIKRALASW